MEVIVQVAVKHNVCVIPFGGGLVMYTQCIHGIIYLSPVSKVCLIFQMRQENIRSLLRVVQVKIKLTRSNQGQAAHVKCDGVTLGACLVVRLYHSVLAG